MRIVRNNRQNVTYISSHPFNCLIEVNYPEDTHRILYNCYYRLLEGIEKNVCTNLNNMRLVYKHARVVIAVL